MRDMGSLTGNEDRGKEVVGYLSIFYVYRFQFSFLVYQRGNSLLGLSFLTKCIYLYNPFLLFFAPLASLSFTCAYFFLIPSLHIQAASPYSSQASCPCFQCLWISFLYLSFTSRSSLSHASFLTSVFAFLHRVLMKLIKVPCRLM